MLIPKLDGLDIDTFTIDIHTYATNVDNPFEPGSGLQFSSIPEDKDVKAILFFCNEPFCPPEIGYTLMQNYHNSVVAGGHIDNLICPQNCINDPTG